MSVAALVLAACGSSGHTVSTRHPAPATPCKAQSLAAIARFLAVTPQTIARRPGSGGNEMPQCSFSVAAAGTGRIELTANIDTAPQAGFRLMRTIVEATQVWSTAKLAAPQNISGLGIEASWFPSEQQLLTGDGVRLITIAIHWRHAMRAKKVALAEVVARTYLGPLHPPP